MKIAVWHNLPSGGGKRALFDHVRGLVERGHTVKSWCPSTADQTYLPLSQLIEERVLPFASKSRVSKKLDEMDRHCRKCAEEINAGGFDLLFANTCFLFHVSCIGRYVNIPKLLYLQEPCRQLYEARPQEAFRCLSVPDAPQLPWIALPKPESPQFLKSIRRFPRDFMEVQSWRLQAREEWLGAKAFDAILVNSFFSRESVLRTYGLDAKVCYLGIDTGRFINQHRARENFVTGLGAISFHKNVKFVLDAMAAVRTPRPKLLWVGNMANPIYFEEMKQEGKRLGIDLEIRVRISDDELVDILNRATMMLYAPRLEPFGFAPLEANACGTPVVAVAEGGIRETIVHRENGLLVDAQPQAMAAAIEQLMSDQPYARQLGENGANLTIKRWSLDAAMDRLQAAFTEVL